MELVLGLPLILICLFGVLILLIDVLWHNQTLNFYFSLFGLLATSISSALTICSCWIFNPIDSISHGQLTFGGYAAFLDIVFCVAGILTIMPSRAYFQREYKEHGEFFALIIFAIAGMMIIAHSANFLVLFLGVELMSLSYYVLAGYIRTRSFSLESSMKYFLLGSFATGFLVYGITMIYGSTMSFDIKKISEVISSGNATQIYLSIGTGLLIVGLSFKIAAFPFHQWAPDVYTGSPTIISGFLSTTGKAAAAVAFIITAKALAPVISNMTSDLSIHNYDLFKILVAVIAAATMIIGNITALVQKNIKRMLAYSSVAHAGYMLIGIVASNPEGYRAILFYSAAYVFMQIGAFIVVSVFEQGEDKYLNIDDYAGLRKYQPWMAACMAIFMFSLAGLPPFAGFFGKYYLFVAAIKSGYAWLAIIAVIASMVSMYFYIGLIIQMYFKEHTDESIPSIRVDSWSTSTVIIAAVATVILGVSPFLISSLTEYMF